MTSDQEENSTAAQTERPWQLQSGKINGALIGSGLHKHRINGPMNSDSLLLNISSQVNGGYAKLRVAVKELLQTMKIERIGTGAVPGDLPVLIPRSDEVAVPLLDLMARQGNVPKMSAVLGLAEDGNTVFQNFTSRDTPHLLVVGGQDAGKTVMLRSMAVSLAINNRQSEIQLAAISPLTAINERQRIQAASWLPLNYLPHMLCDVAFRHTDIIDLLTFLGQEVTYREKHSFADPCLVVFIDQADIVVSRGGRQTAEPILRLAQKGEDVGIHLVLSSQSTDTAPFSTQLMKEIPTRLIGRPVTGQTDQYLPAQREDDAQQLLGEGDFFLHQGDRIQRLQGAYIDDYDLRLRLTEMYRHRAILLAKPSETRLSLKPASQTSAVSWPSATIDQVPAVAG
jgi:DNA segregation ATPase FtsK/SpoIIIE-like protein